MTERVYRVSPICVAEGHQMDDASLPTCTRPDCDEGFQMVDFYLDLEAHECRCDDLGRGRCPWHQDRP